MPLGYLLGSIGQIQFDPHWRLLIRLKQLLKIVEEKRQRMVNAPMLE